MCQQHISLTYPCHVHIVDTELETLIAYHAQEHAHTYTYNVMLVAYIYMTHYMSRHTIVVSFHKIRVIY